MSITIPKPVTELPKDAAVGDLVILPNGEAFLLCGTHIWAPAYTADPSLYQHCLKIYQVPQKPEAPRVDMPLETDFEPEWPSYGDDDGGF